MSSARRRPSALSQWSIALLDHSSLLFSSFFSFFQSLFVASSRSLWIESERIEEQYVESDLAFRTFCLKCRLRQNHNQDRSNKRNSKDTFETSVFVQQNERKSTIEEQPKESEAMMERISAPWRETPSWTLEPWNPAASQVTQSSVRHAGLDRFSVTKLSLSSPFHRVEVA